MDTENNIKSRAWLKTSKEGFEFFGTMYFF